MLNLFSVHLSTALFSKNSGGQTQNIVLQLLEFLNPTLFITDNCISMIPIAADLNVDAILPLLKIILAKNPFAGLMFIVPEDTSKLEGNDGTQISKKLQVI